MAKIMIVDDAAMMRDMLKAMLTEAGHEVVAVASGGAMALNEYGKHLPDLVTMDVTMSDMSGIEALKLILDSFPDAKVVMISAVPQKDMIFKALMCGARNYLVKPVTKEKLVDVVNGVLEINGQQVAEAKMQFKAR